MWIHEDKRDLVRTYRVQQDGSLYFPNMKRSDAGIYSCRVETDYKSSAEESVEARVRIHVRSMFCIFYCFEYESDFLQLYFLE